MAEYSGNGVPLSSLQRWQWSLVAALLLNLLALAPVSYSAGYELVLRGGRVKDPESGRDGVFDVAISDGRIAAISEKALTGVRVIDVSGQVVAPGFIDLHNHSLTPLGMRYQALDGVTTTLELEAGAWPVSGAGIQLPNGAPLNYGASAGYTGIRLELMQGVSLQDLFSGKRTVDYAGPAFRQHASAEQQQAMRRKLALALDEGGLGVGLPLDYFSAAIDAAELRMIFELVGERAYSVYNTPDAGIWEYRGRADVHTSSAIMCWAACDRLSKIADHLGRDDRAAYWRGRADAMHAVILKEAWNEERGAFTGAFGGEDLDASVLLMAEIGFIDPADPRYVATVERIDDELREGYHVYRYRAEDDFGKPQTAFTACTFWHIDALARIGRKDEARAMFEDVLAHRNHLGILSEDIDVAKGELWGNFPQTYSMAGIINAAARLSPRWEDVV